MKIKAVNSKVANIKLSVPFDGTVTVDENGEVAVSDKAGKMLVESGHWTEIEGEEVEDGELQEILKGVKKMSLEDLVDTAEKAGYDEGEYKTFIKNKKLMVAYITKKIKLEYENPSNLDSNGGEE